MADNGPAAAAARAGAAAGATLYIGKLIIDEAVILVQAAGKLESVQDWHASDLLGRLAWLIAADFALAIATDLLGRAVALADGLLSERVTNASSVRLMRKAATLNLKDFVDAEY